MCCSLYPHKNTYPHTCCSLYPHKHIHIHTRVCIHAEISYNTPLQNHMTYSHAIQHTITYHNASPPLHAVSHFLSRLPLGRLHCQVLLTRLATSRPRMQRFRESIPSRPKSIGDLYCWNIFKILNNTVLCNKVMHQRKKVVLTARVLRLIRTLCLLLKHVFLDGSPAGFYTCLYFDLFISIST